MLDQTKIDEGAAGSGDSVIANDRVPYRDEDGVHAIATPAGDEHEPAGSLIDDVTALYEDGKTYVSSELTFQKTRAKYVGKQGGEIAGFGMAAFMLLNLALIGLTVGLIISLATLIGPLAATLIITAILLAGAGVLAYMAKKKATRVSRVLSGGRA